MITDLITDTTAVQKQNIDGGFDILEETRKWEKENGTVDEAVLASECLNCDRPYDRRRHPAILYTITSNGVLWWHKDKCACTAE